MAALVLAAWMPACASACVSAPSKSVRAGGASAAGSALPADAKGSAAASPAMQAALAAVSLDDTRFGRRVLYTWTTDENIQKVRSEKVLLFLHESPTMGPAPFDTRVTKHGESNAPDAVVSRMFEQVQGLYLRRFAWVAPWATRVPIGPVSYGPWLVRVSLKPDALIGRFDPSETPAWRFQDLSGHAVSNDEAVRQKSRIAAVLHVKWKVLSHRYEMTNEGEVFHPIRTGYRELVLCNESMIEEWSVGTPEILDELRAETALVRSLAEEMRNGNDPGLTTSWTQMDFGELWSKPSVASSSFLEHYGRALAFPMVDGYAPTRQNLEHVVRELELSTSTKGAEATGATGATGGNDAVGPFDVASQIRHRPTIRFDDSATGAVVPVTPEPSENPDFFRD